MESKKASIIEYYSDVPIYRYAALYVGISEDTLARWRQADTDFAERLDQARAQWVRKRVSKAKVEFALERMESEVFGQKAELSVTGGENPINVLLQAYGIDPKKLSEGETNAGQDDGVISTPPQD